MNLKDSKWTGFLVILIAVAILVSVSGCGTLINGSVPTEMRGDVDGVALLLNLLCFWMGGVGGVIIDLITGGFWKHTNPYRPRTP